MVCYSPLKGYRSRRINPATGKRPIVFNTREGFSDKPVSVPCGKCVGCLMTRAFYWSVRCVCESHFHDESYFLTLTYDDKHLPLDHNLNRADFQSFMKRLRYHFSGYKLKVFYCGEYGERRHRPHYHCIIFGLPLKKENVKFYLDPEASKRGNKQYLCPSLQKIWGNGIVKIGTFTHSSAAYVAQYTLKKHDKKMQKFVATRYVKPFIGSSRRTSIGFEFFMKYHTFIYRRGFFRPFPYSDQICRNLPYFNNLLKQYFPLEYFKYVELPRRKYNNQLFVRTASLGSSGAFMNTLVDRDIKKLYNQEKKILRKLEPRADF